MEWTKWFSVDERLPVSGDSVLAYDGSDMFVAWCFIDTDENCVRWHSFDSTFDKDTPIIKWMPLPDPHEN